MKNLMLCVAVSVCGCGINQAKVGESPQDFGSEGSELSASVPLYDLAERAQATPVFDIGHKYWAYKFFGHSGDVLDVFAEGQGKIYGDLDTTLSLYKVSFLSGRPYGKALAYNDDTEKSGWSTDEYASSLDAVTLPDNRYYAIVVSTYQHAPGTASVQWAIERPLGMLTFAGTGAGKAIQLHPQAATQLPMSAELTATMSHFAYGPGHTEAARLKLSVADAQAIINDPAARETFGWEMLYDNQGQDPSATPATADVYAITKATAVSELEKAANISDLGVDESFVDQNVQAIIAAMFGDTTFSASGVKVFHAHYDNGDDMSAECIFAISPSTGEVRVLGLYSDP